MPLCDQCRFYNAEYDEMRQQYDDVIKIGDEKEKHHCPMYESQIPDEVYYDNKDCKYFIKEEAT